MTADPTAESVERLTKGLDAWCIYSGSVTFPGDADVRIADIRNVLARLQAAEQECERLNEAVVRQGARWTTEALRADTAAESLRQANERISGYVQMLEAREAKLAALDADYRAVCGFMLVADLERTDPVEEAAWLVEGTAKAIAENGFGRPWDDFLPVNVHDTDQGDLIEYAQAAVDFLSAVPPSQGVEKPEWRAIETAPRDGQSILLICRDAYTPTSFEGWWFDGAWVHYARPEEKLSGGVRKWFPTHWMPKPGVAAPEPRSGDVVGWRMTNFESDTYFFSSNENVEFWKAAGHTAEPLYLAASPVQGGAL